MRVIKSKQIRSTKTSAKKKVAAKKPRSAAKIYVIKHTAAMNILNEIKLNEIKAIKATTARILQEV